MIKFGGFLFTKDLVLYIDAANPKCFNSGDQTCKNLIGGGLLTGANGSPLAGTHTPNPNNFPLYSSDFGGVFNFVNTLTNPKGMNVEEDLGTSTEMTLCVWLNSNSTSNQYVCDGRNDGGQWFFLNYLGYGVNYTAQLRYLPNTDFTNKWVHMTVTSNASGSKLYYNANEVSGLFSNTSIDEDLGKNFRIGTRYTTVNPFSGKMGSFMIYKRVLTPSEIKEVFITTNRFL